MSWNFFSTWKGYITKIWAVSPPFIVSHACMWIKPWPLICCLLYLHLVKCTGTQDQQPAADQQQDRLPLTQRVQGQDDSNCDRIQIRRPRLLTNWYPKLNLAFRKENEILIYLLKSWSRIRIFEGRIRILTRKILIVSATFDALLSRHCPHQSGPRQFSLFQICPSPFHGKTIWF